jgi:SAM-dependent methyltransferase
MDNPARPACPMCAAPQARPNHHIEGYWVYGCPACGFKFVHPTPSSEQLADYYARQYAVPLERYASNSARNESRIIALERVVAGRGRLLEVGASYGHSLAIARQRGWEVAGVELSPTASAYARDHFGLDVFSGDLLAAPFEPASFDAIILWHVLEHTREPQAQIEQIVRLLKPGGVVAIRVPNTRSLGARLAGRLWPWMCPPAHLWYFSRPTLAGLLTRCGLQVAEITTLRGDGNNFYQYALIALGAGLNGLRRRLRPAVAASSPPASGASGGGTGAQRPAGPTGLVRRWVGLLERAQPATDRLARWTRPLVGPLERHGWGDELLAYARRPR